MNLLFLSSELPYPPHSSGGTLKLYHVLRELSKRHSITLLSCTERAMAPEWREGLCSLGIDLHVCEVHDGVAARFHDQPWVWRKYWSTEFVELLAALLEAQNYDLVHLDMAPMARLTSLIDRVPCICAPNDSLSLAAWRQFRSSKIWSRSFPGEFRRYLIQKAFERRFFSSADACIVVSQEEERSVRQSCPKLKITPIPCGVDTKHFAPSEEPRDPNLVLFTGTMDFVPNIDAVIWFCSEVWPRIRAEKPDAEFAVVGRRVVPEVAALVRVEGVNVVGEVPEMQPWLQRCGVYVSPLRLGGGIKNKVLEAMACGCPIACTKNGAAGISNAVSGVHLQRASGAQELSWTVLQLLKDTGLRNRLSHAARAFVTEHYSWAQSARAHEKVYVEVLDSAVY